MKPILGSFEFGERQVFVPAYGVFVTLAFIVAIVMATRRGKRRGFPAEGLLDLAWWVLVTSLIGARLFYVFQHAGDFAALCFGAAEGSGRAASGGFSDCVAPLRIWEGGLVFYGGVIGAAAYSWWYARRKRWSFPMLADAVAPALAAGHAIGRLGCYAAGCCYGHPCSDGVFCVRFPSGSVAYEHLTKPGSVDMVAPPVFALQLVEALALLLICVGLLLWQRRQRWAGQLFVIYLVAYGVVRFVLELYRGDDARRFIASLVIPSIARVLGLPAEAPLLLSTSQAVSLALIAAALLWARRLRAQGSHTQPVRPAVVTE
ncbi:MAG TPA: prolipoprotein diacylglyceryl transferase family protein [Polyangia bacterium]